MFTATLIAEQRLTEDHISEACDALAVAGVATGYPEWLEQCSACDLPIDGDAVIARRALEALAGIDVIVQPRRGRLRRLLVADMDSTMITVECIDELADYAGLKAEVAAITERAMQGELDFEAALQERVALLAGLEEATLERCRIERVRLTPGAQVLVRTMTARGATTILVSGGFTHFADAVGAEIGFDRVVANRLGIAGGALTGQVVTPIVGAGTKKQVLLDALGELGIIADQALAVGDGANDIPMLQAAGLGVAYRAKPAAKAAADASIQHGDLTALLYAQGIPRSEWLTT